MTTQYSHKVRRVSCKWGCDADVDTFVDELGLRRYLDIRPFPQRADPNLPHVRHRLWEHRGDHLGWCLLWPPIERSWRPLRLEHACRYMPRNRKGAGQ